MPPIPGDFPYPEGFGMGDLSMMLDVSVAAGLGADPTGSDTAGVAVAADPRREYVAAALVPGGFGYGWEGAFLGKDAYRPWHSTLEYRQMLDTPAPGRSFNALRFGALSGGVTTTPAVDPADDAGPGDDIEADMAAEIADSNRRTLLAWKTPVVQVLYEAMEAMVFGHKLAEPVADDIEGGPDDGLLAVHSVKFKPRMSYRFRVDRRMNVVAIHAVTVDDQGQTSWELMDPDHFAWLTWDGRDGDPRGLSIYRMAVPAFRRLELLWRDIMLGWRQFGVPMTYGTTAEGARMVPDVDRHGKPKVGPGVTAEFAMARMMNEMQNGSKVAGPYGSAIKVVESTKDATVVAGAISVLEDQQVGSILLQVRATTEAKHGSRADSQTGQDIMGTVIQYIRTWLEGWLRAIFVRQNTWNYGEAIALRLTPRFSLGDAEHQDWSALMTAFATLFQGGGCTLTAMQEVYAKMGLTAPKIGDLLVTPNGVIKLEIADTPAPDPASPTTPEPAPAQAVAA
jgi:hypothetical protein